MIYIKTETPLEKGVRVVEELHESLLDIDLDEALEEPDFIEQVEAELDFDLTGEGDLDLEL